MNILNEIRSKINVPKSKYNDFGGYKYRSSEDILDAARPVLLEYDVELRIQHEIKQFGAYTYIQCFAELLKEEKPFIQAQGFAREQETKKGMDAAQITGCCMSYSTKYALCNLFLIDDGIDSDSTNQHESTPKPIPVKTKSFKDNTTVIEFDRENYVFTKGKHENKSFNYVLEKDPGYIKFLADIREKKLDPSSKGYESSLAEIAGFREALKTQVDGTKEVLKQVSDYLIYQAQMSETANEVASQSWDDMPLDAYDKNTPF
jgi:hypothetical protein